MEKKDILLVLTNIILGISAIFWFGVAVLPYTEVIPVKPW